MKPKYYKIIDKDDYRIELLVDRGDGPACLYHSVCREDARDCTECKAKEDIYMTDYDWDLYEEISEEEAFLEVL